MSLGDSFFTDTTPAGRPFEVLELGQLLPQPEPRSFLKAGMVGYMAAGIKERSVVTVGDFICDSAEALHAHRRSGEHALLAVAASPKVYASVYSVDSGDFDELRKSLERLTLNDASVHMKPEMSGALGAGFRLGFLGRLHMEVFFQRLHDEFETDIIATAPTVPYWAVLKDGSVVTAETPAQLPCMSTGKVDHYLEQMALVTVLTPVEHMGPVIAACKERRGRQTELLHLDEGKIVIKYMMPWQELIIDLHDEIKSVSSGFASFDYVEAGTEKSKVGKVDMLLNGKPVDALTFVCHQSVQHERGKEVCAKLR
jgi:GTP-binding protein LepA